MGVTIQQIAQKAGVSEATVSRVMNGLAVREETGRKIKAIIRMMKYRPNRFAQALSNSRKTGFLGVLTPALNPYVTAVIMGIEEEARRQGKLLILVTFTHGTVAEREIIQTLTEPSVVEGLLVFLPPLQMESLIRELAHHKFPMVVVNERRFENILPSVIIDNFNGGKQATEYLIQKGHKRIGFITGPPELTDSRDREEGYRQALKEAGIAVEEGLIQPGYYTIKSGLEAADKFLKMSHLPNAIFAANDEMAIGVLKALQNAKKERVFAVMGCGDIEISSFVTPALTTVGYDLHELGVKAVQKLIHLGLGDENVRSTQQLNTHLIIRESA